MAADNTLELRVKMGVEGKESVDAANRSLADTGKATGAVAKATEGLSADTQVAYERAREHGAAQREIFRVTSELNGVIPGLGEAMRAAFEPESIGIVGALLAIEGFKAVLEDIHALDEIKLADFAGDKEAIDAVREAYEKAAVAAQVFIDEQIRQNAAGQSAEDIAKRQIENFKNLTDAQRKYNAAQKNLGDAEIDEREKSGVISHEQALQAKFALDVEYARKKLQLEAQTDAQELAAKQQQLATEKQQLAAIQANQKTDEANAAAADATKVKHGKQKELAQKNIEDAQKTLEELGKSHGSFIEGKINEETVQQLKEYYEKYVGGDSSKVNLSDQFLQLQEKMKTLTNPASWDMSLTNFLDRTIGSQAGPAGLAKYQGAQNQIAGSQKIIDQLDKKQFDVDLNAERGKKQLDATDEEIRKLSKSVEDLSRSIPQTKADNAAKLNNAAGVENLNLRADAVGKGLPDPGNVFKATPQPVATSAEPFAATGTGTATERPSAQAQYISADRQARRDWSQLDEANKVLGSGGQIDAQQAALLEAILKGATGHAVRYDKILETIHQINESHSSRDAAFERLRSEVERLMQHPAGY